MICRRLEPLFLEIERSHESRLLISRSSTLQCCMATTKVGPAKARPQVAQPVSNQGQRRKQLRTMAPPKADLYLLPLVAGSWPETQIAEGPLPGGWISYGFRNCRCAACVNPYPARSTLPLAGSGDVVSSAARIGPSICATARSVGDERSREKRAA